ncbi:heme NO-binding domain-containing protein [Labilibaculum sp. DW002]|jgi:heme-NO-binding protein|uniref:Heme NO-binding domain-containing protein n=1 Tax=Paralabilibaculum antarcticum TaxID=2912572 RepID=A0ABT5VW74_9BACT|nr:heme NO-binding domain-containing protein [Labilibaculum sp. DW002]MDE5419676.1 heme NO-binding domain-containing protein [Labilibaculum sp. DW002]
MKGLIFCEFLEMVEEKFGYETVDEIIEKSNLPSKGIYTSVGTYSHEEMFSLVGQLSVNLKVPVSKLFYTYGVYVFGVFGKAYKDLIIEHSDAFQFLSRVEDTIHVQVLKLYPEAELPTIEIKSQGPHKLELIYTSQRKMADFAEGLIQGCLNYFNEDASINKVGLTEDQTQVLFTIQKNV